MAAAGWLVGSSVDAATVAQRAGRVANTLEAVDVQTLPGQQLQLTLRLSGPAPEPLSFTIDNPARISLDLPNTALALPSRRIDVRSGGLDTILAAEAGGRTRLVMNLDRLVPYETTVAGDNIVVDARLRRSRRPQQAATDTPPARRRLRRPRRPVARAPSERSISVAAATARAASIVNLSDPRTPINLRQQGNQIVVDFAGARCAAQT